MTDKPEAKKPTVEGLAAEIEKLKELMRRNGWTVKS